MILFSVVKNAPYALVAVECAMTCPLGRGLGTGGLHGLNEVEGDELRVGLCCVSIFPFRPISSFIYSFKTSTGG